MPSRLPSAPDLLAVVREFLETGILPASGLDDDKRFNVRVAVNLLATVERELRLGPEADAGEAARLAELASGGSTVTEKNRFLACAIRVGTIATNDPQLLDHLRRTLADTLRINNPKWLQDK